MFIRNERSIKEFVRLYPAVSALVGIYLILWLMSVLHLPIYNQIYYWGVGQNLAIHEGNYWRLFTSTFLHAGLSHVAFNSFSLVLFGPALERMIGRTKFLLIYLGAGIIGNLGSYLLAPEATFLHLGASGAIYGLFGVYIYMILFRKQMIDHGSAQIVWVFFILGVAMTFIQTGIHMQAHLFGAIGGFALSPLFLQRIRPFYQHRQSNRYGDVVEVQYAEKEHNAYRHGKQDNNRILWIVIAVLLVIILFSWM
ncbi:rhomboid family intramembrane serine protease [Aciduricibacillus chroicocephali]|uniref:Rhomboid family intramembrane serine protease n=1 Tax=Aciduricibacillus chroicocephali TaxID=3054939 RepID=A0ABY9KW86_9BACI|nr:rhomboid family intramembrane serine protease [Bacillaceae bacterium 44XB]